MPSQKPKLKRTNTSDAVRAATPPPTSLIAAQKREVFEGPLPHPDILQKYEQIMPGIAERIVQMAEREQDIRAQTVASEDARKDALVALAQNENDRTHRALNKGQNVGLFITVACVIAAFVGMLMDKNPYVCTGFLAIPTASFIASFMPKLWKRNRDHKS